MKTHRYKYLSGRNYCLSTFVIIALLSCISCEKFLRIDPPNGQATPDKLFENDEGATSAVLGIYSRMATSSSGFSGGRNSVSVLNGLSADELLSYSVALGDYFNNDLNPNSSGLNGSGVWYDGYAFVYTANSILENLVQSDNLSTNVKRQLKGESLFIRAFCYFYLINIFGEVPLNLTTDYRVNRSVSRSPVDVVYKQIVSDLLESIELLSSTYITGERIRPNKWAAMSLLSRVYLYIRDFEQAKSFSSQVIEQSNLYGLCGDLDSVFLKNSKEAIWQLMPPTGTNTPEGLIFVLTATPIDVSLSPEIMNSFLEGDLRKEKWTNSFSNVTGIYFYPFKYKVKSSALVSEYSMVLRLAELYLIRAECNAQLGSFADAAGDINVIRQRAGIMEPFTGAGKEECLEEIIRQRQSELFTEYGHRWLDLKRLDIASEVLNPVKGNNWSDYDVLYPIPESEITRNPSIEQNKGY